MVHAEHGAHWSLSYLMHHVYIALDFLINESRDQKIREAAMFELHIEQCSRSAFAIKPQKKLIYAGK